MLVQAANRFLAKLQAVWDEVPVDDDPATEDAGADSNTCGWDEGSELGDVAVDSDSYGAGGGAGGGDGASDDGGASGGDGASGSSGPASGPASAADSDAAAAALTGSTGAGAVAAAAVVGSSGAGADAGAGNFSRIESRLPPPSVGDRRPRIITTTEAFFRHVGVMPTEHPTTLEATSKLFDGDVDARQIVARWMAGACNTPAGVPPGNSATLGVSRSS